MTALKGRHALITGANRGIGAAIARTLSAQGASVTLMVRTPGSADAVLSTLSGPGAVVVADVTDRAASQAACAEAATRFGPIDILVNNAGYVETVPFYKADVGAYQRMFDVHVLAAVHTMQAVMPAMVAAKCGHIVNVASIAGLMGAPYVSAYVAAKHALVGLTRSVALELAPRGILVNAVCPGYVDTELVSNAADAIAAKTGRSASEATQSILDEAGQKRMITVEEVADAVLALCSAAPGSAVGQAIVLDGSTPAR